MKSKIITAAEARAISEVNKSVGINSIMDRVEEYAAQGKKEFEIGNKLLFKRWKDELISLGYTLKIPEDGVWILSWDNPKTETVVLPSFTDSKFIANLTADNIISKIKEQFLK